MEGKASCQGKMQAEVRERESQGTEDVFCISILLPLMPGNLEIYNQMVQCHKELGRASLPDLRKESHPSETILPQAASLAPTRTRQKLAGTSPVTDARAVETHHTHTHTHAWSPQNHTPSLPGCLPGSVHPSTESTPHTCQWYLFAVSIPLHSSRTSEPLPTRVRTEIRH